MSVPLKFTVNRLGKLKRTTTATGTTFIRDPADDVQVFAYAVVNGTTSQTSGTQYDATLLSTVERLQVIAPARTFPYMWGDGRTVVTIPGDPEYWRRVDAEENYDANPYWSPGMSVFYFERTTEINE